VAQDDPPPPCSQPEARQFDFWIGTWDLFWGEGDAQKGVNVITAELGDCVVEENFAGDGGGTEFIGNSVSVYNAKSGKWRQTWVDNRGGYLVFEGGMEDDRMVLYGSGEQNGETFLTRMIFADIEKDSLTWNWERSTDDGATWEPNWVIQYRRHADGDAGR